MESDAMELDDKLCYCFHVSQRKVINFIRIHKPKRASQVSECGGAGTGCGWCIPFLKKLHKQIVEGTPGDVSDLTPADYAQQRGEYIRSGGGTPPPGATPIPDSEANPSETDNSPENNRE